LTDSRIIAKRNYRYWGRNPDKSWAYNGNLVSENSDAFPYNGDNQLVSRTADGVMTTTHTCDGQGNLVKRWSNDGTSTVYIGGIHGKHRIEAA
jgi:YD repeat-containing protein